MANLINSGNSFSLADFTAIPTKLPNDVYNLVMDPRSGIYSLERTYPLQLPEKIYGNFERVCDRYIKAYHNTKRNLGVLLTGLKGNGKTILAKLLCKKLNQPVILVTESFKAPQNALEFLTSPELGNCTILMDEFEKVFNNDDEAIYPVLQLLDGPKETHHFFILTTNSNNINTNFINRPSRIHFTKSFSSLDLELAENIIDDKLIYKEHKANLLKMIRNYPKLSLDILITIIDDINLFNEEPNIIFKEMGLSLEHSSFTVFQKVQDDWVMVSSRYWLDSEFNQIWIIDTNDPDDIKHQSKNKLFQFLETHFKPSEEETGTFYVNRDGVELKFVDHSTWTRVTVI